MTPTAANGSMRAQAPATETQPFGRHRRSGLGVRICEQLQTMGVRYCAWKGDPKLEQFECGASDLDLLVDRHQLPQLTAALTPFGFRATLPPQSHIAAGVHSFVAPHPENGTLVHVHVHLRLLIGPGGATQFHLPIERAILTTSTWSGGLRVPSPAFGLILHVLHQTMRHRLRDLVRRDDPAWLRGADATLAELEARADPAAVSSTLQHHLPLIPLALFEQCTTTLRPRTLPSARARASIRLRRALSSHRRASGAEALLLRLARRGRDLVPWSSSLRSPGTARPSSGGAVIALVGGDGAGKSTCAAALRMWLGEVYDTTHAHLGRPPRGLLTFLCGGALKLAAAVQRLLPGRLSESLHAHAELVRVICTARDRARLHARIHRRAAQGAIVISERHPASEHEALAGPSERQGTAHVARSLVAKRLRRYENALYRRLARPDLTLVLRLEPETAVRRKPEEPASYVRRRAELVWARPWDRPDERPIDAGRPLPEVLQELRRRVWEAL